jgi:hypothetical protein
MASYKNSQGKAHLSIRLVRSFGITRTRNGAAFALDFALLAPGALDKGANIQDQTDPSSNVIKLSNGKLNNILRDTTDVAARKRDRKMMFFDGYHGDVRQTNMTPNG